MGNDGGEAVIFSVPVCSASVGEVTIGDEAGHGVGGDGFVQALGTSVPFSVSSVAIIDSNRRLIPKCSVKDEPRLRDATPRRN